MQLPPTPLMTCAPRYQTRVAKCVWPPASGMDWPLLPWGTVFVKLFVLLLDYCGLTPVNLLRMEKYCWNQRSFGCKLRYGRPYYLPTLPFHMPCFYGAACWEKPTCAAVLLIKRSTLFLSKVPFHPTWMVIEMEGKKLLTVGSGFEYRWDCFEHRWVVLYWRHH